ncbi:hypothetical protein NEAUS04_2143 [Nematocida ausubeli]|uniref:Zinc-ribbon 15 domain-containing protein n=1 Tax=Nematocida ausubeli (strain ATCC PRA-371 / ERTm2) TaxID=1913371 RepID=H8ZFG2_NEMA1|nr:uncharacterized protein NESG_00390 [Nematocida ausubeli]EHY64523.1 hypothetical protein NERG_02333 [Nematocida ausubeli]KAI5134101.1 hypothetical protein NEAUS07_0714 [Nematocida ausubeli]KAI5135279.1 hypothetical protein NEAUS06_1446 [Nematocida ausubeli]KAI5150611.1 hypothetical protein NEAUS05_2235 [Nematocida ausubeli]KAI5164352.1 hypothetical protein NEAUS04_2143 [Nematocida ausubeli]
MLIKEINRQSSADVEEKDSSIVCSICKTDSKIVARRNTKWLTLCFLEVLEIKKYSAYAACSNCLNALPDGYGVCEECRHLTQQNRARCENCSKKAPEIEDA